MSKLTLSRQHAETVLGNALTAQNFSPAAFAAHAAIWLEACDYPGLQILEDGMTDTRVDTAFARDQSGIDLRNMSCVKIGERVLNDVSLNGRTHLRNVRHGLFLVPASVMHNLSIGCAVDASFAFGGVRILNPYAEKLAMADEAGVHLDEALWTQLTRGDK